MSKKILVVDDSPTEMKLMLQVLQGMGHQVITAEDGEQAIAQAAAHKPNLILLDIVLPKKNGFQVCRQLKTAADTKDIKVILVSSKNQESDRFWGMKQGADEYMTKPYRPEDLAGAVQRNL